MHKENDSILAIATERQSFDYSIKNSIQFDISTILAVKSYQYNVYNKKVNSNSYAS